MKAVFLIVTILLIPISSWSQRPARPIARPPRPPLRNNVIVGDNIILPGAPSNVPNTNADTDYFAETNVIPPEPTNNKVAPTNVATPEMVHALGLTNRLSVMARAQVHSVTLLQAQLNDLQQAAALVNSAPNIQQVIHENPQIRQQVQMLSARIINLARGPDRPSLDSIDRLSVDLLRACSHAHLDKDGQLVLAIVINLVVNCQDLPPTQIDSSVNDGLIVLRNAQVSPVVCNAFGCDLNSIALEIQPNLGI